MGKKNKCLEKKTCPHGKCEIDAKGEPKCVCALGYKGTKCDKRNITIERVKLKHLISKSNIYMDDDKKTIDNLQHLDELLKLCDCSLNVTQSFTKLVKPTDMVKNEYQGIVVGRALRFNALFDKKGKKAVCNEPCLLKRGPHTNPARCFYNGLDAIGWKRNLNGLIIETNMVEFTKNFKGYKNLKEAKQVGCQQDKHFPVFKTRDHLLVDYNPSAANHCPHGLAGLNGKCDKDDLCVKKNPCRDGSTCSLDAHLKPVCGCKNGYKGSKCDKKNCTIKQFKGDKGFGGHWYKHTKFYISEDAEKNFKDLDDLAETCKVQFAEVRGFTKNTDPNYKINEEAPQHAGYGFKAMLKDSKGKLLCNELCLGKDTSKMQGPVKCIMSSLGSVGFGHNHKHPGHFYVKSLLLKTGAEYKKIKELKQVGCSDESWYKKL